MRCVLEIITIGDKLELGKKENTLDEHERKQRVLSSRVLDMPQLNLIRIAMPFFEGRLVPLAVGEEYVICFYTKKGLYESKGVVVNRLKDGQVFMVDIELKTTLKKIQRREYFRHHCRLPALYRIVPLSEKTDLTQEQKNELVWTRGVIIDLSGGGMKLISERKEEREALLQVKFSININDENCSFLQYVKIVASVQNQNKPGLYEQRTEFVKMGKTEREQIISYIFQEERKIISKEKGLS